MRLFSGMSWCWLANAWKYCTLFWNASGASPATNPAVSLVK